MAWAMVALVAIAVSCVRMHLMLSCQDDDLPTLGPKLGPKLWPKQVPKLGPELGLVWFSV
ncbi:hypothetical protein M758_1G162100 [Ceratodon purpureus]|nr:hypothetical protein M758_1G162100 [Ceratodon purpureus]